MISLPPSLQIQLSEAVKLIADHDFPDNWPGLMQVLSGDLKVGPHFEAEPH